MKYSRNNISIFFVANKERETFIEGIRDTDANFHT